MNDSYTGSKLAGEEDAVLQVDIAYNGDLVFLLRVNDRSEHITVSQQQMLKLLAML